jgi:hypothetical protein
MTRDQASTVLSRLRVRVIESNAHGILIQRAGVVCEQPFADGPTPLRRDRRGYYNCEQWRVESHCCLAMRVAATHAHGQ